jgi:PAS domain-containing protein
MSTVFLVILLTLLVGIVLAQHNRKKRVEAEVRKSEERFRLFMDNSPAIAWMKDEQGQYVYINETYQKQLGVRLEDRIGKTDLKVYPHAIAQEFRKNDEDHLNGWLISSLSETLPVRSLSVESASTSPSGSSQEKPSKR